jgi:hypothetical protein
MGWSEVQEWGLAASWGHGMRLGLANRWIMDSRVVRLFSQISCKTYEEVCIFSETFLINYICCTRW